MKIIQLARKVYNYSKIYYFKIFKVEQEFKVPFLRKLKMNFLGFTSDQYIRYNLKEDYIGDYISEFERWKSRTVNGRYNLVLDDKIIFQEVFMKYVDIPKNIAWVRNGKVYDLKGSCIQDNEIIDILEKHEKVYIKPVYGSGGGRGVHLIRKLKDNIYMDDRIIKIEDIKNLNDYIVVEFVEQHRYSREIFDKSTNTIRLITTMDSSENVVNILHAVHRIGVKTSIPVDNCRRGALAAKVDINTGILGGAKTYFDTRVYDYHPDTKKSIKGVKVPHWDHIKTKIIEVAKKFPYIPFMAWDIVITENSFSVIEINASTGLDLLQIWEGERNNLLGDFYREHNIIK